MLTLLTAAAGVAPASPAAAHPTDEVVQQVYLTPARSGLTVQLELTPGVLVAAPFVRALDTDGDGALGPAEVAAHAAAVGAAVTVTVDGRPATLTPTEQRYPPADLLAAAGGTVTLVWTAPLPAGAHDVVVADRYVTPGRPAVQMSVLVPPDPVALGAIRHADGGATLGVGLDPGEAPAPAGPAALDGPLDRAPAAGATMLDALRRPLGSPGALAVLLGACVLLGALHALTPGHGKALLASYLVGERGTPRHAATLGIMITFTHTAAVVALGAALLLAGRYVVPDAVVPAVVPVLTAVAGVVVVVLGLRLVRRRRPLARRRPRPDEHAHGHGHGPPPGRAGVRGLAALALSAGMVPCPEALSVLLLAVGLGRAGLGLTMIVAFGVGLAAVLVGLGLLLVTAAPALARAGTRLPASVVAGVPLASAVVVVVLGGAMAVTGVSGISG